jgi:phospholipid-transporting ATPase
LAKTEQDIVSNLTGAKIECEQPNEFLYKFQGNLELNDGAVIPLDVEMMMLRGSMLRNTEWVYGVAVFTGHETKVMKNSARPKAKKSRIEKSTNNYIIVTICI